MSNPNSESARPDANVVTSDTAATVELTAYQSGPAVIRETRVLKLAKGKSHVYIGGLPKQFVPNSQTIVSVAGKGGFKLGQRSLRPANLTQHSLLQKSIGSKITLLEPTTAGKERRVTGQLVDIVDGRIAVLRLRGDKILVMPITQKFELGSGVPAGLSNLTVLAIEPDVTVDGEIHLKLLYESEGISWTPVYEVFYNAKTGKLERFACHVDLANDSGATFEDAGIKLIAGHNHSEAAMRAHSRPKGGARMMAMAASAPMGGAGLEAADFSVETAESENVGDQKMYKVATKTTLENGVPNSPTLIQVEGVPVMHEYHAYNAGQYFRLDGDNPADLPKLPVNVKLRLLNAASNGLGAPLPPGEVRIFEPDSSGELQKTDSARIGGHIAVGEEFSLDLRNPARDIKIQRQLVDYKEDPKPADEDEDVTEEGGDDTDNGGDEGQQFPIRPLGGPNVGRPGARPGLEVLAHQPAEGAGKDKKKKVKPAPRFAEEIREITILNYKDVGVEVVVHDNVPLNAEVLDKSHDFVNFGGNSGTGTFRVEAPAKSETSVAGELKVRYHIRYRIN